jgi:uncharacterized damage-inducible protein DinB
MRTIGAMARELLSMAAPMAHGLARVEWSTSWASDPLPKADVLARWDEATAEIDGLWPDITAEKLNGRTTAFGQYEGVGHDLLLYVIDNEVHHRAQGFVYLRALGVEPPPFYDR